MRFAPAAARNGEAILAALRDELRGDERVLELAAGTGQHACLFAAALPGVHWQPSEHPSHLGDLRERVEHEAPPNVADPLPLDITDWPWALAGAVEVCFAANVVHMIGTDAAESLMRGAAACLSAGGRLILYGPFAIDGMHTGEGNRAFDAALRAADPARGVRDLAWLDELAQGEGFRPSRRRAMPSDNRLVVWERLPNAPAQRQRSSASPVALT